MSNRETCDYCDQPATMRVKLDMFARNVDFEQFFDVCDDCVINAEMAMEDQGYLPNEYYTTGARA